MVRAKEVFSMLNGIRKNLDFVKKNIGHASTKEKFIEAGFSINMLYDVLINKKKKIDYRGKNGRGFFKGSAG